MKKKTLFIILGVVLALALILLVLWLCAPDKATPLNQDTEDTKYPCVVTQDGENLKVEIDGGVKGYEWAVTDYGENTASAVVEKSSEKGARILVKPLMAGASRLTISLQNTENPADMRSQIFLNVMVQNGAVSLVSQTRKDLVIDDEGKEKDGTQPFILKPMMDGSYRVNVIGKPKAEWSAFVVRGTATVTQIEREYDAQVTEYASPASFTFTCKGEENCVILIKDDVNSEALKIEMKYDAETGFSPLTTDWLTLPTAAENVTKAE